MSIGNAGICRICVYHAAGIFDDVASNAHCIFVFFDANIAGWLVCENLAGGAPQPGSKFDDVSVSELGIL